MVLCGLAIKVSVQEQLKTQLAHWRKMKFAFTNKEESSRIRKMTLKQGATPQVGLAFWRISYDNSANEVIRQTRTATIS